MSADATRRGPPTEDRRRGWRGRPRLSRALEVALQGGQVVAAAAAGIACAFFLPAPNDLAGSMLWWAAVLTATVLASKAMTHAVSQLLPLPHLLRLSLVFPDHSPRRWKVARETVRRRGLARRIQHGHEPSADELPPTAAGRLQPDRWASAAAVAITAAAATILAMPADLDRLGAEPIPVVTLPAASPPAPVLARADLRDSYLGPDWWLTTATMEVEYLPSVGHTGRLVLTLRNLGPDIDLAYDATSTPARLQVVGSGSLPVVGAAPNHDLWTVRLAHALR